MGTQGMQHLHFLQQDLHMTWNGLLIATARLSQHTYTCAC